MSDHDKTALPLSQQIIAWLAQAAGALDGLSVGQSTTKSALRGEVISNSWQVILRDATRALGNELIDAEFDRVQEVVRDYDEWVAGLESYGLPLSARLPTIVRFAVPQLATRLGAAAAVLEIAVSDELRAALPEAPEWLCDPLSASVFGRFVEAFLALRLPELTTWEKRYDFLDKKNVAAPETVRQWRIETLRVPKAGHVEALAELEPTPELRRLSLLWFRIGRVLTVFRAQLQKLYGQDATEELRAAIRDWADSCRQELRDFDEVVALAKGMAVELRSVGGPELLIRHPSLARFGIGPWNAAAGIDRAVEIATSSGHLASLRPLIELFVFTPPPAALARLNARFENRWDVFVAGADWAELIRHQWQRLAMYDWVANGELGRRHGEQAGSGPKVPSPSLRNRAARLRERARQLVPPPAAVGFEANDDVIFMFEFALQSGFAASELTEPWNEGCRRASSSGSAPEVHAHLAAAYAAAGLAGPAIEELGLWKREDALKLWPERRAVANALGSITWQHVLELLDRVDSSYLASGEERSFPELKTCVTKLDRFMTAMDQWLGGAEFADVPGERLVTLFPVAVGLDAIDARVRNTDSDDAPRTLALAADAVAATDRHPTDPNAWAVRAAIAYTLERTRDFEAARKRAVHFGGGRTLDSLLEQVTAISALTRSEGSGAPP